MRWCFLCVVTLCVGCGDELPRHPAPDLGVADQAADAEQLDTAPDIAEQPDLAEDSAPDLVEDQAPDLAEDMPPDTAPDMCECRAADGPCCDGCMFKAADVVCSDRWRKVTCTSRVVGEWISYNRHCSGTSASCEGRLEESGRLPLDCSPADCLAGEGDNIDVCQF